MSFANPAWAFHFMPAATKFGGTAPATLSFGNSITCSAAWAFKTNRTGSKAKITRVSFSNISGDCGEVHAVGLPWTVVPTTGGTASIMAMSLNFSGQGINRGPGDFPITVSGGSISFNAPLNPGGCNFSGTIPASPAISIGP
ncbi:MAG: hypothetical protein H0X27_09535 [Caulobacteraceae bacterium]|nr:hypothetical protein [Caulobacteraceae bacterium]